MFASPRTQLQSYDALRVQAREGTRGARLVVMLPGINIVPEDFETQGVIGEMMAARRDCDVAVAALSATDYLEDDFPARFDAALIEPARAAGYREIALVGLSLGTFGALRYVRAYPAVIADLVMIAPFLGTPGTIAEITRAGGLMQWEPPRPSVRDNERHNLLWLKAHLLTPDVAPVLALGFGTEDRFAAAMHNLAAHLPRARVRVEPGAHEWDTWRRVWRGFLSGPFFASDGTQ